MLPPDCTPHVHGLVSTKGKLAEGTPCLTPEGPRRVALRAVLPYPRVCGIAGGRGDALGTSSFIGH